MNVCIVCPSRGYDLNADTFSPDGRLFQVEYATKAVDNGGTALGLVCTDGVVIGIEKLVNSKMLVRGSNRRSVPVDDSIALGWCAALPGRDVGWGGGCIFKG